MNGSVPTVPFRMTVIIVNYNSGMRLGKCLDHLAAQTRPADQIIVVDNASADTSAMAARRDGVSLIEAGENLGFAAANNLGADRATGDWLIFLNPDAYAEPDWLENITSGIIDYPWADAFGSLQLSDAQPDRLDGAGDVMTVFGLAYRGGYGQRRPPVLTDRECFAPCAAAAAYRARCFRQLGGFDPRFFCYGEDVDLAFRLRHAGGRVVQLAQAIVRHEGSAVSGRHSAFTIYHGHRNRIWLFYKNTPPGFYRATAPARWLADFLLRLKHALDSDARHAYNRALKDGYGQRRQFSSERPSHLPRQITRLLLRNPLTFARRDRYDRAISDASRTD